MYKKYGKTYYLLGFFRIFAINLFATFAAKQMNMGDIRYGY